MQSRPKQQNPPMNRECTKKSNDKVQLIRDPHTCAYSVQSLQRGHVSVMRDGCEYHLHPQASVRLPEVSAALPCKFCFSVGTAIQNQEKKTICKEASNQSYLFPELLSFVDPRQSQHSYAPTLVYINPPQE